MAVEFLGTGNPDGTVMGRSDDLLGFFGNTVPVAQRAAAAQGSSHTAVATTAPTSTSPYGFSAASQGQAVIDGVNLLQTVVAEIQATLTGLKLWKGAA